MNYNICRFLPERSLNNSIKIVNLVNETETDSGVNLHSIATYRIHYITSGTGILHTEKADVSLKEGDILIIPPAFFYDIENTDNIKYMYISFFGLRANALAERFNIWSEYKKYSKMYSIADSFKALFDTPDELIDIHCESVILYAFVQIGKRALKTVTPIKESSTAASNIKKFIDENFNDCSLCIKQISNAFSYHPKYISTVFKKEYNICITDYIRNLRIQNACILIDQGITSIKTVALLCGYEDPLYFSTVFKREKGLSPTDYINNLI